jgi:hypothetical protein
MKSILVLILLVVTNSSTASTDVFLKEIQSTIKAFNFALEREGFEIENPDKITFKRGLKNPEGEESVAICVTYTSAFGRSTEIQINLDKWVDLSTNCRTEAILHEMFHCSYGMDHISKEDTMLSYYLNCKTQNTDKLKENFNNTLKYIPKKFKKCGESC